MWYVVLTTDVSHAYLIIPRVERSYRSLTLNWGSTHLDASETRGTSGNINVFRRLDVKVEKLDHDLSA